MKPANYVFLSTSVVHACGETLKIELEVSGDASEITLKEQRFTFVSFFATAIVHFKAHGARLKYCPRCQRMLPTRLGQQWDDSEFQQGESRVK
jgi:hypothetical protein